MARHEDPDPISPEQYLDGNVFSKQNGHDKDPPSGNLLDVKFWLLGPTWNCMDPRDMPGRVSNLHMTYEAAIT